MTQTKADNAKGKAKKLKKLKDSLQMKGVEVYDEGEQGCCLTCRHKHCAKINPRYFNPNTL